MTKMPKRIQATDMSCVVPRDLPKWEVLKDDATRFGSGDPADVLVLLSLLGAGRDLGRMKESHFAKYGLSDGRFFILMMLRRIQIEGGQPATPADLAEKAAVSRATITGLLDGLEKEGLIARVPRQDDRRMIDIRITEQGLTLLESTMPEHYARLSKALAELSTTEKDTLTRLLTKVREGVASLEANEKA
ncbi:MAG TPA: MarR family transcriptional regulator [Polyangiaceae bacterium]